MYSGSSRNFIPKRRIIRKFCSSSKECKFSKWITKLSRTSKGYYLPSKERNILPFEQEQVGPGLNLDPNQSIRVDGGRHEEYRPLPKTVDELRSTDRPKITYKGVMKPGQRVKKVKQ